MNYTRTKPNPFALDALNQEIQESLITISINSIIENATDIDISFAASLSAGEIIILDAVIAAHTGIPLVDTIVQNVVVDQEPPFAAKKIIINGVEKSLFKRVHGANCGADIAAGATINIDYVCPYPAAKFTAAEIFGVDLRDTVNFYVLDTDTNTYSGFDVATYGANFKLNQFGFDVEMPPGGKYFNTSNYDADIYQGMIIRCEYTNNGSSPKYIGVNPELHEVK